MCWEGLCNKKVADKDIKVYKVLLKYEDKYVPYYLSDKLAYEVGKLYKQEMVVEECYYDTSKVVNVGFHSYSMERTYVKRTSNYFGLVLYKLYTKMGGYFEYYFDGKHNNVEVTNGFLSDKTIILNGAVHFVKCIIPKGAEYFENEKGEIVSNMIIVTGEEMDKDAFVGV